MTRSTPARLYQDRSSRTTSPAAGRCGTYRWKYHWVFSRSLGAGSATIRADRGLRYSATRLIALRADSGSCRASIAIRVARCRSSTLYFLGAAMTLIIPSQD